MKSQIVLGGRFRVFDDGSVNIVRDGIEAPAKFSYTGRGRKYATVSYMEGGMQKHAYVHRLVASAFVDNPLGKPQVNHIDGNTRNNRSINLEWVTPRENVLHAYEKGLSNPMATAVPCSVCGEMTKAKDGICTRCKINLKSEANKIDAIADRIDRYSGIDLSLLTETEKRYVQSASKGMSVSEIAAEFSVSKQCVSAALIYAEKKNRAGSKLTCAQKNMQISLLNKLNKCRKKLESAKMAVEIAEIEFRSAEMSLKMFEDECGI